MIKSKKHICIIIFILLALIFFCCYNIAWYVWRDNRYTSFSKGLDTFQEGLSYVLTAEDGYLFNVKYPAYLQYTGNMCVATPDSKYALLIWPNISKGFTYGVQLEIDGEIYSIMLNADFTARESQYDEIITTHELFIQNLKYRAEQMWDLSN